MIDDVDVLVSAWRRERPDLDVSPLEVLSRVSRIDRQVDILRRAAFAEFELEPWEFDVLAALRRAGEAATLSPGQLSSQTLVTSGTITNRVDRLERRALVRRERDPDDRRGISVVLTDEGRQLVDRALASWLERERTLLAGLPAQDQAALADMLRVILTTVDTPAGS